MLVVGSVVWDEEAQVGIIQHSGDSNEARPATRHNGNILPGILALLPLAMLMVVEIGYSFSQRLYSRSRSIFPPTHRNFNGLGAVEATLDVIVYFWSSLTQVCPFVGTVAEAVLIGTLCAPNHTGRGAGGIEAGVWTVAFMGIAELTMDVRAKFTAQRSQQGDEEDAKEGAGVAGGGGDTFRWDLC